MRIYLAWQEISDGRQQVRRWSPDELSRFLGYQKRTAEAIAWLRANGDPRWPDCFELVATPFETIDMTTGEISSGNPS